MAASREKEENCKEAAAVRRIIGENLRYYRLRSPFPTQEKMAEALGIQHKTYSRYEHGDTNVPGYVLRRFHQRIGVPLEALFQDPADEKNERECLAEEQLRRAQHVLLEAVEQMLHPPVR